MNIVIATTKPWFKGLQKSLSKHTSHKVTLIDDFEQLSFESLSLIAPDYVFFPHWNYIIPEVIYSNFECVIFHMTDVPFGRGGSPMQNLIARGIYDTKISALKAEKELDAGPVYLKRDFCLKDGSAQQLFESMSIIIEEMIIQILETKPIPAPQVGKPKLFKRRTPSQSDLKDLTCLQSIYDYIRMLDAEGYPSAFIEVGNMHYSFTNATLENDELMATVRIKKKHD